jgi:hypothetical protein
MLLVKEDLTRSEDGLGSDPAEPHISFRVTAGGFGRTTRCTWHAALLRGYGDYGGSSDNDLLGPTQDITS